MTLSEALECRATVAELVLEDPIYTPILDRLERIVAEKKGADAVTVRARKIVERQRDMLALI